MEPPGVLPGRTMGQPAMRRTRPRGRVRGEERGRLHSGGDGRRPGGAGVHVRRDARPGHGPRLQVGGRALRCGVLEDKENRRALRLVGNEITSTPAAGGVWRNEAALVGAVAVGAFILRLYFM